MAKNILVTGGAGYIGSHTCVQLLEAGHDVVVVDNLVNSSRESLNRVEELAGRSLEFHEVDKSLFREKVEQVYRNNADKVGGMSIIEQVIKQ